MSFFKFENPFIEIFKILFLKYFKFDKDMEHLHDILNSNNILQEDKLYFSKIQDIGKNDRMSIFIQKYHEFVDSDPIFFKIYHNFILKHIKPLFPNEKKLVIQKTPNLRISFPYLTAIGKNKEDPENIIGLHCDSDFGHHFEEINFIVPITNMFCTNSIYYEPEIDSNINYNDYLNLILNTDTFFTEKFNKLKHYNKINTTNVTRISLDLRVIPYSKYMEYKDFFINTKFDIGKYYIAL